MLDCQTCGACCQSPPELDQAIYVRVSQAELVHLQNKAPQHVVALKKPSYGASGALKMCGGQCSALLGQVGEKVSCSIYEDRPSVCKQFEPESECCYLAREEAGLSSFDV